MGIREALRIGTGGAEPTPKTVIAAAMPMIGPEVARINRGRMQQTQEQWQREAWYYFDATGELRGPLAWIANAVSQAELHATTLDPDTGLPTGPSENSMATAVAAQAFGGAAQRAGLLRLIALCWQVCGEAWIIIQPQPNKRGKPQPDKWLVLSGNKVQAKGTEWQYTDPFTGALITLTASDRLIRVWCPHPDDQAKADSAVRPALPILREIEKASQNIAARLDSRIATNGIVVIADELSATGEDFMAQFMNTAELGLQNPGQASSQVPLAFNAPGELIASGGAFAHFDLNTEFDASVVELRTSALDRLASTLDMPKDVAAGTQGESNHWSAWLVSEDTYKIFIKPLLQAVGDAVTEFWMHPALIAMGMDEDQAQQEEIGWDTTAIVARPDDRETLESLYDKILISDEYMLTESGVSLDAMPSDEERTRRMLEKIVIGAPTLLADPNVAEAIGLEVEISPVAAGVDAKVNAAGELEAPEPEPPVLPGATPDTQGEETVPAGVPGNLTAAAGVLVMQALDRAGGRLLTNQNRGQYKDVQRHELYQHIRPEDPGSLVEIKFSDDLARAFAVRPGALRVALEMYVTKLLTTGQPHDPDELNWYLR
jgi:hypothetical protein